MRIRSFRCGALRCRKTFGLVSEEGEEHYGKLLLGGAVPCPSCEEGILTPSFKPWKPQDSEEITAKDLWLASMGLGFPEEREFDHVQVIEMLTQHPITFVAATMKKPGRVQLNHIVLRNGRKLHFGEGATIYKIEEDRDARESSRIRDEDSEEGPQEHASRSAGAQGVDVAEDGQGR